MPKFSKDFRFSSLRKKVETFATKSLHKSQTHAKVALSLELIQCPGVKPGNKKGKTVNTISNLKNGSTIRVKGIINRIEVVTLAAVAAANGETVAYHEALDAKFNRPTQYAWTYQEPGIITADYKGKAEALEAKRREIESAPYVETGDLLEIDGVFYVAKVLGNYSDPVKLTKATELDLLRKVAAAAASAAAFTQKPSQSPA